MDVDELDAIADDELLYRRVPASASPPWFDPVTKDLSDQAFAPHKKVDVTGLSIFRAKAKPIEALGRPGKSYYVAILRAGDLKAAGVNVVPRPVLPDGGYDAAHAELPDLNAGNYKHARTLELQRILVSLCLDVVGPFHATQE